MAKFYLSTNYFCFNFYFHLSAATVTSKFNNGQRNSKGVITNQSFNQGQRNWHKSVKHYGGWHHPKFERLTEITNFDKGRKQKKREKRRKTGKLAQCTFFTKIKYKNLGMVFEAVNPPNILYPPPCVIFDEGHKLYSPV